MARKRRSPRVVWLPQDPFHSVNAATLGDATVMRLSVGHASAAAGDSTTVTSPVVRDTSPNPLGANNSLADIEQSGYRLRRIVGKYWATCDQLSDPNGPSAFVVTLGFIILRTDNQAGVPLSAIASDYSTNTILNTQDPWIFRRSWFLRNNLAAPLANFSSPTIGSAVFPPLASNVSVGGNLDGPHIDQKTARVIGPEERLFMVHTVTNVDAPTDPQAGPSLFDFVWDLRILVSMRTQVGNRRNASR